MLKVRLQRRGKRNYAAFRVVLAEDCAPVKGRFIEDLGSYNPHTNEFNISQERTIQWIKQGAQPSATIHNLLITHNVMKGEKVRSWSPKKKAEDKKEAPPQHASPDNKQE